jgi:fatty acid amide hydrolase
MHVQEPPHVPEPVEPTELGASALAHAIATQRLRASDVVEAYIRRIEQVNPRLNALVFERFADARREASAADQRVRAGGKLPPLLGVPVTLKDTLDLEGAPSTFGIDDHITPKTRDADVVRRVREAGAIVVAKSNIAQLLLFVECSNPRFGRTNHPMSQERSCGGSSGGEGALVAAHASALGFGTDIGGSVRVPAAFCGVVGFKPTAGRCVDTGRFSVPLGQQAIPSQIGVIARNVDDAALGLRVAIGDGDDQRGPLANLDSVDIRGLRVAVREEDGFLQPCPAARRALREAVQALTARGAQLVPLLLPTPQELSPLFACIMAADRMRHARRSVARSRVEPQLRQLIAAMLTPRWLLKWTLPLTRRRMAQEMLRGLGDGSAADYFDAVDALQQLRSQSLAAMSGTDVVLTPAQALPAVRHGATTELGPIGHYTSYWNTLGWPAGVVPVTHVRADEESDRPASNDRMLRAARETERGSAGLPIAVQIASAPHRDHVALAALRAIESAVHFTRAV